MIRALSWRRRPFGDTVASWCGWAAGICGLGVVSARSSTTFLLLAVGMVLIGAAVASSADPERQAPRRALVAAGAAAVIAAWVLVRQLQSAPLDNGDPLVEPAIPMVAACATALVIAAAGVWLRHLRRPGLAHLCGVTISLFAWVVLSAYLYGIAPDPGPGTGGAWPLPATIGLDVVGLGLIWLTPGFGLLGLARRGPAARLLLRAAVPVLAGFPMAVGWLNLTAIRGGWYSTEFSAAVMAIAAGTAGGLVLWYASRSIVALDEARVGAMAALAEANLRLEEQVVERTAKLEAQTAIQTASFEALEQGVAICSLDAEVLLLNRAGRDLLGYEADELSHRYLNGEISVQREDGSVIPVHERPLVRTMREGATISGLVMRSRRKDGREAVLRVNTQPIFDDNGVQTGAVVALVDITAERAAQRAVDEHLAAVTELNARLERAVRMKDRLLSTATHDMRSPIATVIGFSELLGRDDLRVPDDKRLVYLDAIHRQGRRLEALVQDLMTVAVIDGGRISVEPRPVELGDALWQAAMDAQVEDQVEVHDPDGVIAFVDPLRLAQILTNLLQNAVRYGRPPFVLAASAEGTDVVLRVIDRGDGVDPDFVPKLFDPYSMAPPRPGVEAIGTGLGLAIVRGLAEMQGGSAWHEPAEPCGSCFAVRLPAGSPADEPPAPQQRLVDAAR